MSAFRAFNLYSMLTQFNSNINVRVIKAVLKINLDIKRESQLSQVKFESALKHIQITLEIYKTWFLNVYLTIINYIWKYSKLTED